MDIFWDFNNLRKDENTFLTIGSFDGIHVGHRKILETLQQKASANNGRSLVITFDPHPRSVLSNNEVKILTTLREKKEILSQLGIQDFLIIRFTKEFSQVSADEFLKDYLLGKIGMKEIFIGYNHHFGKGRAGNKEMLEVMGKEFGFEVTEIQPIKVKDETVSSTSIKAFLEKGQVNKVSSFLGRNYSFSGTIVEGDKRGRTLGFPTANIKLEDSNKLLPSNGVYVVEFHVRGEKYYGLLSVGKRPTFHSDGEIIPEVYLFEFDEDIYGEFATVILLERLRGEEKFSSADELIEQMKKDEADGSEFLSSYLNENN
jgi:riboflavin kinase / FMN adenylyltransferase